MKKVTPDVYRETVVELIAQIQDIKALKRIYEYVSHCLGKAG